MTKENYYLPDGQYTHSYNKYEKAWLIFGRKFAKVTGLFCKSFNGKSFTFARYFKRGNGKIGLTDLVDIPKDVCYSTVSQIKFYDEAIRYFRKNWKPKKVAKQVDDEDIEED